MPLTVLAVAVRVAVPMAAAAMVMVMLDGAVVVPHMAVQHQQVDEVHGAPRQRQEKHHCTS